MSPVGRRRWMLLLRFSVGFLLLAALARYGGWSDILSAAADARARPGLLLLAVLLTGVALAAGAVRWHCILRSLAVPSSFLQTLRAFFIGQFFNAFLLGACGGDLARAVLVSRRSDRLRAEAVTSVFLDRAIGLVLTLLIGCGLLLPQLPRWSHTASARPALLCMGLFLILTVLLVAILFTRNLFDRFPRLLRNRFGPLLQRVYNTFYHFRLHVRRLFWPVILSLLNLLLLAAAAQVIARALGLPITPLDMLTLFPVVTVLAALPFSPGGIGIREFLYIQLLAPLGVPDASAIILSLLTWLAGTVWSAFGGLLFLLPPPSIAPQKDTV